MNKLEQKFIVQNGREATLEEVSVMMEMPRIENHADQESCHGSGILGASGWCG